jgi:hypothetical protein
MDRIGKRIVDATANDGAVEQVSVHLYADGHGLAAILLYARCDGDEWHVLANSREIVADRPSVERYLCSETSEVLSDETRSFLTEWASASLARIGGY